MARLPRSTLSWAVVVIAVIAFIGAILAFSEGIWSTVGKVAVALAAFAQAFVAHLGHRRALDAETKEKASREDLLIAIDRTVAPLVKNLRDLVIANTEHRRQMIEGFVTAAVGAALALTPADGVRVNVFLREGGRLVAPRRFSVGRSDRPTSVFKRGCPEGDAVWDAAEREETRFCPDTEKCPPEGWDASRKRDYKTFITVPIVAKASKTTQVEGLLTVNAPRPGDLDEDDKSLVQVLAGMLGVAFSLQGGLPPVERA